MAATQSSRAGGGLTGLLVLVVGALVIGLVLPGDGDRTTASGIPEPETEGNALMVPSIDLDAPVRPIPLSSAGVLDPPEDTDKGRPLGRQRPGRGRCGGRLVLVTCTDWNGSDSNSNIVVLATPVQRQGFGQSGQSDQA